MSDDLTNDDEQVDEQPEQVEEKKPARSDNRFKDLSEKVELTAKERDEANAKAAALEKELDFHKGFSKVANKFQNAADYEEKIKEKVLSGADMEEATVAVLYKAGKLDMNTPQVQRQSPAGGSASTAMRSADDKPVNEMTTAEKRERLLEWERTNPGEMAQALRSLNL
jgi:hypothetical protein